MMEYGLKPCAIAVCFVLVALIWTFPLQHVIAYPFVFLFFGAIMGSAWFGGATVSGFMAVVFLPSSLAISLFLLSSPSSIAKESQSFFAAFILCAIAITVGKFCAQACRKRNAQCAR